MTAVDVAVVFLYHLVAAVRFLIIPDKRIPFALEGFGNDIEIVPAERQSVVRPIGGIPEHIFLIAFQNGDGFFDPPWISVLATSVENRMADGSSGEVR